MGWGWAMVKHIVGLGCEELPWSRLQKWTTFVAVSRIIYMYMHEQFYSSNFYPDVTWCSSQNVFKWMSVRPCTIVGEDLWEIEDCFLWDHWQSIDSQRTLTLLVEYEHVSKRHVVGHSIDRCIIGFQKTLFFFQTVNVAAILASLHVLYIVILYCMNIL